MTEIFIEKCKFSFKHSLFQLLRIFYLNSVSSQLIDAINNNNNAAIITVAYTS